MPSEIVTYEPTRQLLVGFVFGLLAGVFIGFMLWRNRKQIPADEKRLEQLQVAGLWILVGYLLTPIIGFNDPNPVIVTLIVSIIIGEKGGLAIAKALERTTAVDASKRGRK